MSAAAIWEARIKEERGRLDLDGADLIEEIVENGFLELPISATHADRAASLPRHHDDPFDRVMVAQAQLENLILVSNDGRLPQYGVQMLW